MSYLFYAIAIWMILIAIKMIDSKDLLSAILMMVCAIGIILTAGDL